MRNRIYSLIVLLAIAGLSLTAQEKNDSTVHKSVTVTREFQPVIMDAGKIITAPKIVEPQVAKDAPAYSNISTPLSTSYNIHTLKANELLHIPAPAKKGFARIGFGSPINTLADFSYPILSDDKNLLDFSLHHLGAFHDKKHSRSTAALRYNHLFSKLDVYAAVNGSHDFFNYYGRNFLGQSPVILSDITQRNPHLMYDNPLLGQHTLLSISGHPLDETHWRAGAEGGIRSLPNEDGIRYNLGAAYQLFSAVNNAVTEHQVQLKGLLEVPFNYNSLGMKVDIFNFNYGVADFNRTNIPEAYSLIKVNPYLNLQGEQWIVRLGAKMGISMNYGQVFTPSPDVYAEWFAIPESLSLYGGVGGDIKVNSLDATYLENRYLAPELRIKDTYTPLDAFLGVKFSPVAKLMFDLYGSYSTTIDQYFYKNRPYSLTAGIADISDGYNYNRLFTNRFDVDYANMHKASVGMRASWEFRELLQLSAKGAYNYYALKSDETNIIMLPWHMPVWEADFYANVNLTHDLSIGTHYLFQGGRYARLSGNEGIKLKDIHDLNLTATYSFEDWISVFLRANNLLNNKHELFSGYQVQGVNVMGGVSFSF